MQPVKSEATDDQWLGKTSRYEGLPLALRVRPYVVTLENQRNFPQLAAITPATLKSTRGRYAGVRLQRHVGCS